MAVSNYTPNKCKYKLGKLDNVVYLIDEESLRDIRIDNGEAYINDIAQAPLELLVYNIALQDTSSLNERYVFTHSLTFSKNGYASHRDLNGKYYAIVKTVDNEYWLVNPMMSCKVAYTYTLDGTQSKTDFTLSTASNFPTLRVHGMSKNKHYECGYVYCKVKSLKLNETAFSIVNGNHVYYTNQGFNEIDFNKNSLSFSESFDGDNVSHSINFKIDFSAYKDSWHYNLLEFTRNKYAAILTTTCGQTILTGFHFGYQPSFTVTANDDDLMDSIEINLSDNHDNGNLIGIYDTITESADTSVTWVYTSEYNGYECVGLYTAKYLLKKELDAYGNPTNRYMCLEGYESRFPDLEIIDTFDEIETFTNYSCSNYCEYSTNMPSQIVFYDVSCKEFTLTSDSDWTLTSNQLYTTVSPSSGVGGSAYTITVCNTANPQSSSLKSKLTLSFCDKSVTFDVTVTQSQGCLPLSDTYSVGIQGGELTIPTNCCIQSVSASCCVSNIQIYDGYVTMYVDANTTTDTVYIPLVFQKCDGSAINATIIQTHAYTRWQYLGRQCHENQWCIVDRMYSGQTSDNINIPTDVVRYRDCEASSICNPSVIYKWENMNPSTDYYCNDCETTVLYKWENMNPSTDFYCNNCEIVPQYRWIDLDPTVDYYCEGTTKYYKQQEQVSTDNGLTWENVSPPQYRRGESAQTQSSDCGYIPTIEYRWIDLDPTVDYYCSGTTKYYKEKKQYSVDSGVTWIDVTPAEYQWGASAETESTDCGYVPPTPEPMYEWRRITPISGDSSTFVCDSCETLSIKFYATYSDSTSYLAECNSDTTLTSGETRPNGYSYNLMKNVVIGSCVNAIGDKAFYFFSLTSVTILNSVTSIGGSAFENCRSLQSVNIPNSVTTIGNHAFNWCSGMTSCTIGSGVTSIGKYAFSNCRSLKTVTIPDSVTSIGMGAFYASDGLTSINIPSGVTSISEGVFGWCTSLTSIDIPSGVTSIGNEAFKWCNRMTSVTIPTSVTSIGASAFTYCDSLKTITIPSGVTSIGDRAFYDCTSLASITVEATTPPTINSSTFSFTNDCLIYVPCESIAAYKSAWSDYASRIVCIIPPTASTKFVAAYSNSTTFSAICDSDSTLTSATTRPNGYQYTTMTSCEIGNCITIIDGHALSGCSSLSSVTIPDSVTSIGGRAFCDCSGLTSVTIPDSVTTIGDNAFTYCSGITSVTIGSGVTAIGNGAFADCPRLVSITINATTPPIITQYTFSDTNDCPIYVPSESVNTYKTATNWSTYASRIEAISQ